MNLMISVGESVRVLAEGKRHAYLALEFAVLFIVLPTLYMVYRPLLIHPFPVIWGFAALCVWVLKRDGELSSRDLWGATPRRRRMITILGRFLFMASMIAVYVVFFEPERLFAFPRSKPLIWLLFVIVYPILSVIPQGIVYRVFVFRRYHELFGNGWALIAASGLVFCYAHILYRNPIALILTLFGGFFFAHTYAKSDSPLFSHIEHALYGNFVFTIGLGSYIYSGSMF